MACCLGFTACGDDDDYEVGAQSEGTVSFGTASANATVTTGAYSLDIDLYRKDTASALDVPLTVVSADEVFTIPSSAHFNAGESKTSITVDFPEAELAVYYTFTIRIPEQYANVYATSLLQRTIYRDYTWIDLGKGTYTDNWGWGITYDVDIQQAEGFSRYRVMAPYAESMINDDAEWGDWLASSSAEYVEFWTESNGTINFNPIWLGLYYSGDSTSPIYAYSGSNFKGCSNEHNVWLDSKTLQLAPYYYINGVGGWNYTEYDGVIVITLP
jgi:hypothetical protein